MKNRKLRLLCTVGIFSALIFAVTAYLKIPTINGYVHVGDSVLLLASCMLPMPYSLFAAAVGAALADVLTGYAVWAPGSVVIKGLMAMLFTSKGKRIITARNLWMLLPAAAISIVGYFLYTILITGDAAAALVEVPGSVGQAVASSAAFVVLGLMLDRLNMKNRIGGQ